MSKSPFSLHLLTHYKAPTDKYLSFIDTCAQAGITHLQLRQKDWSFTNLKAFGLDLQNILKKYNIPLIINDNLKLAIALDAHGIHLGQNDTDVNAVRQILGLNKIIGLSIENLQQLEFANSLNTIDYVAASAIFPSKSKLNLKTFWGINGLQQFCKISKHPIIAIGGINHKNIHKVRETSINGIAIISAIHEATNPKEYIYNLLN